MKKFSWVIAISFLVIYSQLFSQDSGTIKGTVNDNNNIALIGAQIYMDGESAGDVTDKNGLFEIQNLSAGTYTVTCSMIGYETVKIENVHVESGNSTQLKITLKQAILESEDEIIVYATKIPKSIKSVGGSVYMIDREQIKQTESRNIEETLTKIPGTFTEDRFHGSANLVSFRGIGLHSHVTRGILVLVDGISINEAMGRVSFEGIDLENVERIEVLKGPVSALYGPNGITGVMNIITKTPSPDFHSTVKVSEGSYNTRKLSAMASTGFGGYKFIVNGSYYHSGGYQDHSVFESSNFGLKINNNFNDFGIFDLAFDYSTTQSEYSGTLDYEQFQDRLTISSNKYTGGDKDLIRINLKHQKFWDEKTGLSSNIYYRSRLDDGHYMDTRFGKDNIQLIGWESKLNTSLDLFGNKNTIVLGASLDYEDGIVKEYNRVDSTGEVTDLISDGNSIYQILGLYIQDEYELFKSLSITAGLRYDQVKYDWNDRFTSDGDNSNDNSISAFSPKIGFAYNPFNKLTVFGNAGIGFNPPQISQLFIGSSYSGLPNQDLKPEYLTNYEIGLRGKIMDPVAYQVSFYNMDFKDQIVADGDPLKYENIGDTRHRGIETSFNFKLQNNLKSYISYSYLDARFIKHPDYENKKLRKTPENMLNAGLHYKHFTGIGASVDFKWMDKFYMDNEEINIYDGHSLVNAKLNYEWRNYYFSMNVNNVFDTNYATYAVASYNARSRSWSRSYYPGWPRNFTFTIRTNF